ncbi:hypothetical protein MOV08_43505 [Streptomyces yunnanensis]|uniref:Uncharacterized protein n=1 Tax=Streptomyces yunnanensis TaxID=156453 RepID=A0ABY8ANN4_9ACTN|nr:hypothetical protein [Streptomyces yunnanensis]WEB37941.1 hypothetical protein MOV08_00460 [Streptomyces yunnanensis]WEB45480.1 hypothetical protein MOV08_43505 [Streptomyces yunnanensis]
MKHLTTLAENIGKERFVFVHVQQQRLSIEFQQQLTISALADVHGN